MRFVFLAADSGHRYLSSVYRKYEEALDTYKLSPLIIKKTDYLTLPWSVIDWGRNYFMNACNQ